MLQRFTLYALLILTGFISACSNHTGPTQPDSQSPDHFDSYKFIQAGPNSLILGAWEVFIDPSQEKIEAVQLRSADWHFNVTPMITPPNCYDCFLLKNLSYDPDTQVVTIDVGFRNPSNFTGHDVRGIVTQFGNMEFVNPDGYTELFSPVMGEINPFVAYKTGIGQREFPPLFDQYETMEIYNPSFPSFASFTYVVESSWPDNCKEPYEVLYAGISGNLFSDGSNAPVLQLYARDWQDDVESVSVDLAPIGGAIVMLTPSGLLPDVWVGPVSCSPGTTPGDYEILVWATSSLPVDQIADIYNYITLKITEPPNPDAEIFGIPERISNSPAESFIWPRHAIAVTSDGASHVVWVDYSSDGVEQHLFYSRRDGGIWTIPQQIDNDGQSIYATIATDSDDTLHVVWEDSRDHVLGSDIYYASSSDSFSTENILVNGDDGFRNIHPKIVSGPDNSLHMAWHSMEMVTIDEYEYDLWYNHRPSGSPSWDGAVSVVGVDDIAEVWPAIAGGPASSAYIAYQSDESGAHGIYFTKNPGGVFIDPVPVTFNEAYQPSLDVAPDGSLILVYFNNSDGTYTDIFARISSDSGDTWGTSLPVSDSDDAYQYAPDVECTPDGDYHFAWHEEDETGCPGRVLYREYLNGIGWQDIIELVNSLGMGAFPSMDSDSDGHIYVVYQLHTPAIPPLDDNYEIWYRNSVP